MYKVLVSIWWQWWPASARRQIGRSQLVGRWEAQGEKTDPHAVRQGQRECSAVERPRHTCWCCRLQDPARRKKERGLKFRTEGARAGATGGVHKVPGVRLPLFNFPCERDRRGRPQGVREYGTRYAPYTCTVQLSTSRTLRVPNSAHMGISSTWLLAFRRGALP